MLRHPGATRSSPRKKDLSLHVTVEVEVLFGEKGDASSFTGMRLGKHSLHTLFSDVKSSRFNMS